MNQLLRHLVVISIVILLPWAIVDCQVADSESHEEEIAWSSDFEQGNARNVQQHEDGAVSFTISPDPGGDQYLWFFLKIAVDQSEPVDFVLMNAAKAHQTGNRWNITRPFISENRETWYRAIDIRYGKDSGLVNIFSDPVFRFRSPIVSDTIWIAYFQPYTNKDLYSFIAKLDTLKSVRVSSLGLSEEGRTIPHITVAKLDSSISKRKTIWIVGREHPGETPLSFVCEGIIEALLNHPTSERLRTIFDFRVVPILNVDGVFHGHYYHNATGVNLARDWVDFKATETRTLRDAIIEDIDNSKVNLLINLHSSNDPRRGHFFLRISPSVLSNEDAELQRAIFSAADKQHPQIQGHSPVKLLDLPGITGNALYRDFGIYCLYFESNYSRGADGSLVTIRSLREVGVALVQTLAEVLIPE